LLEHANAGFAANPVLLENQIVVMMVQATSVHARQQDGRW